MGWRREGTKGEWETCAIQARGVGIGHVNDVDEALTSGSGKSWPRLADVRAREEERDPELEPMVKKKMPVAWRS